MASNSTESHGFTIKPWHYAVSTMPGRHAAAGALRHGRRQWCDGRPATATKADFLAAPPVVPVFDARHDGATSPVQRDRGAVEVGFDSCGTTVTARNRTAAALANLRSPFLAAKIQLGAVRARTLADLGLGHTYDTLAASAELAASLAYRICSEEREARGATGFWRVTAGELVAQLAPRIDALPKRSRAELLPGLTILQLLPPEVRPTPGRIRKLAKRAVTLSRRDRIRFPPERWHERRKKSVSRDRAAVVRDCGSKWAKIHCGCTSHLRPIACGQREMCTGCGERWRKRLLGRLLRATRGLEGAIVKALKGEKWGRTGRWALLSLSVSSVIYDADNNPVRYRSIEEQQNIIITEAWPKWRAWVQKKTGRSWPYAWVPEVTDGESGGRHPHVHCIIMLPMIPFGEMADEWVRATDGAAGVQGFEISTSKKVKDRDQQNNSEPRLGTSKQAAQYICKYATKGLDCAPETAAEYWEAMYGRRRVSTSQDFWELEQPLTCPDCGCGFVFDGISAECTHGNASQPDQAQGP